MLLMSMKHSYIPSFLYFTSLHSHVKRERESEESGTHEYPVSEHSADKDLQVMIGGEFFSILLKPLTSAVHTSCQVRGRKFSFILTSIFKQCRRLGISLSHWFFHKLTLKANKQKRKSSKWSSNFSNKNWCSQRSDGLDFFCAPRRFLTIGIEILHGLSCIIIDRTMLSIH